MADFTISKYIFVFFDFYKNYLCLYFVKSLSDLFVINVCNFFHNFIYFVYFEYVFIAYFLQFFDKFFILSTVTTKTKAKFCFSFFLNL